MRIVYFLFLVATVLVPVGSSAPVQARDTGEARAAGPSETAGLSLDRAVARSLQSSPVLAAGRYAVSAAEARVTQAGLLPNPELELEAENFGGTGYVRGFESAESTVLISQPILLGGKRSRRRAVAESEVALTRTDLEALRLNLVSDTASAFYRVLAAQKGEALAEELLGLAERFARTVQARVDAGKVSPVEATRAGIEVAQARVRRGRAVRDLAAARARLAATWGSSTADFDEVIGKLPETLAPPPLEHLQPLLLKNPEVLGLERQVQRQQSILGFEGSLRIPDLTVSVGPRRFEETGQSAWVAGLSLPLPIFDRNQGARKAAEFELERVRRDAESSRVALGAELVAVYEQLHAATLEASTMGLEIVPGAEAAFAATEIGYSEGKFSFLDVLDAQRAMFEARSLLLASREEYALARTELERLVGREPAVQAGASPSCRPPQGDQR